MEKHKVNSYNQKKVVERYKRFQYLFKAEKIIFKQCESRWKSCRALDIGVGTGRTSYFLGPMVKDYTGLDLSPNMIQACRDRFPRYHFMLGDAITLEGVESNNMDVVLFSFNGLDCINPDKRAASLQSIYRVLKANGELIFSFHNIGNVPILYSFQWPKNPMRWIWEIKRRNKVKSMNPPLAEVENKSRVQLWDGDNDFKSHIVYSSLTLQIEELQGLGFKVNGIWEAQSGKKLNPDEHSSAPWIYIHCQKQ